MTDSLFHLRLAYRDNRLLSQEALEGFNIFQEELCKKYPNIQTFSDVDITLDGFCLFHMVTFEEINYDAIKDLWTHGHMKLSKMKPDKVESFF